MENTPEVDRMLKRMEDYRKTFNDNFPLYLESDPVMVMYYINECLLEKKSLEELFPEKFGDLPSDISI